MTDREPVSESGSRENLETSVLRQTVELIVVLCLGVLLFRTFSAEAYVVPTGSMAPTLLGHHRELTCPNCQFPFAIGLDEEGHSPSPVCPNCGTHQMADTEVVDCNGDRVLVQKFLYDFRAPHRWEVAVFNFPGEPTQAYVKRVVGLPGESIQVSGGNVFVNGKIARKTPEELRAMQVLVHDSRFSPRDSDRYPRWSFVRGWSSRPIPSGWRREAGQFRRDPLDPPVSDRADQSIDWLVYRHWDPVLNRYGPIRDHYAYNGADLNTENRVPDLAVEARIIADRDVETVAVKIRSGSDLFVVHIPVKDGTNVEVFRNEQTQRVVPGVNPLATEKPWPREVKLEASVVDHRLTVLLDDQRLFEPLDYDDPAAGPPTDESPVALGVKGGELTVRDFKIFRDLYYTNTLGGSPRHPHGVNEPFQLKDREYFVLGDNSPVSNDSRFWNVGPVVSRSLFVGKPFLVHLPGQVVGLEVFGRSVYWVPDPRRIRYIH